METRDLEISRFARKADGYKAALQAVPTARTLELLVTVAIIEGLFKMRGWSKNTTPIVDLMSGTGVVSDYLKLASFGAVHSIEACHEMLPSTEQPVAVEVNEVRTLVEAYPIIKRIQPAVIVSLAGLHHLIEYEGKTVNRFKSVLGQVKLIEDLLPFMKEDGLFLIVDIVEPTAHGDGLPPVEFWDGKVFQLDTVLPDDIKKSMATTRSLAEYQAVVNAMVPSANENPTLRWFREVVDAETVLGHDDVALSRELVHLLRRYHKIRWARFRCPWIFQNEDQLKFFLARKFGFMVDRKPGDLNFDDLLQKAKTHAGIHALENGRVAFGWNLAVIAVPNTNGPSGGRAYLRELNLFGIAIALLLLIRIGIRFFIPDQASSTEANFDKLIFVFVGLAAGVVFHWLFQRKSPT